MLLCAVTALLSASVAEAQNGPLTQSDRSSPRDTLAVFLQEMGVVAEAIRDGRAEDLEVGETLRQALGALDYSGTPHGDTWLVRIEYALMLADVLERIDLPVPEQVPGDEAVARESLEAWTLPGSDIQIRKMTRPGGQSEFLFSPETVEHLDRYHRKVRDLPSKRGTELLFDAYFANPVGQMARADIVRSRLQPIDTSSPRSTLEGFLDSVNRAFAIVEEAESALRAEPPRLTREQGLRAERLAGSYLARAISALDLHEVPDTFRGDVGQETALQLKEILDRLVLPPLDAIPGDAQVRASAGATEQLSWTYPNTDIEIVKTQDGANKDRFLFSAKSVGLIPTYYERVKELPYRSVNWEDIETDYLSPSLSPGFYDKYVGAPGYLVPAASWAGKLIDALPAWMGRVYCGQALWQWVALAFFALVVPAAVLLVFLCVRRWTHRLREPFRSWLSLATPIVGAGLFLVAASFLHNELNISGPVLTATLAVARVAATAFLAWGVFRLAVAVSESVIASPMGINVGYHKTLIRVGARSLGFLLGVWVVVAVVQGLGVELLPLIAGLGLGGLAVALAAQKTLSNFLGGFVLILNRPVQVGDLCFYGEGKKGTVEEIGLLSTRLRTQERSIVTIPNADFSEYEIDNLATRDRRLFESVLRLRYETSPRQLRYLIARLRQLLEHHPRVEEERRVRLIELGEYSLDVEVHTYVRCQGHDAYLAIREDLLLQIVQLVEESGTAFVFPASVQYSDPPLEMDPERGGKAEAQVERWWAEGKLASPGFKGERPEELDDTTGYVEERSADVSPPDQEA